MTRFCFGVFIVKLNKSTAIAIQLQALSVLWLVIIPMRTNKLANKKSLPRPMLTHAPLTWGRTAWPEATASLHPTSPLHMKARSRVWPPSPVELPAYSPASPVRCPLSSGQCPVHPRFRTVLDLFYSSNSLTKPESQSLIISRLRSYRSTWAICTVCSLAGRYVLCWLNSGSETPASALCSVFSLFCSLYIHIVQ